MMMIKMLLFWLWIHVTTWRIFGCLPSFFVLEWPTRPRVRDFQLTFSSQRF